MNDQRDLFDALIADGRPLIAVTAFSLFFAGGFALFLTAMRQFLPQDVEFLRVSAMDLCAVANCRINAFMFHDRAAFGGSLMAVGVLYFWLVEFPLRGGERWAWWTLVITGTLGFLSFLAYMGYGYLDSWHGIATLALLPVFATGIVRARPRVSRNVAVQSVTVAASSPQRFGRVLLLATALGMVLAGGTILTVGMTVVFVKHDLLFMGVSRSFLEQLNPRLIPLIAHDRSGFGGGLLCTGLIVAACVFFSPLTRSLRQALWAAGMFGFGCAIGIHFVVGYISFPHLGPAFAGAAMFASGMVLTRPAQRELAVSAAHSY